MCLGWTPEALAGHPADRPRAELHSGRIYTWAEEWRQPARPAQLYRPRQLELFALPTVRFEDRTSFIYKRVF